MTRQSYSPIKGNPIEQAWIHKKFSQVFLFCLKSKNRDRRQLVFVHKRRRRRRRSRKKTTFPCFSSSSLWSLALKRSTFCTVFDASKVVKSMLCKLWQAGRLYVKLDHQAKDSSIIVTTTRLEPENLCSRVWSPSRTVVVRAKPQRQHPSIHPPNITAHQTLPVVMCPS